MAKGNSNAAQTVGDRLLLEDMLPQSFFHLIGRSLLGLTRTIHGLTAFAFITLGVTITKFNVTTQVIRPLIRTQIYRAGLRLLPMVTFLAGALGLVIIG